MSKDNLNMCPANVCLPKIRQQNWQSNQERGTGDQLIGGTCHAQKERGASNQHLILSPLSDQHCSSQFFLEL